MAKVRTNITEFNFPAGYELAEQYRVIRKLGAGWEGEVYLVEETETKIQRAIKFFYPDRNYKNKVSRRYAVKLHKLRHCPVLIQYMSQDYFFFEGERVSYLVSEYVEGIRLDLFLKQSYGKRLPPFEALHLLYALVVGLEPIHNLKEYHGDLHTQNVIIMRYGLSFDLKILDMFHWGSATRDHLIDDLHSAIRIFYDAMGGAKIYPSLPEEVKYICSGLRKDIIVKKFKNVSGLKKHIETMQWQL